MITEDNDSLQDELNR